MASRSINRNIVTVSITASANIGPDVDQVSADATSGAITAALYAITDGADHEVVVRKTDSSGNAVTVTDGGSLSVIISVQNQAATFAMTTAGVWFLKAGGNASGAGDFVGPASSTDNAIVRFDGTSGKTGQNSAVTIADTTGVIAGTQGITFSGATSGTTALVPTAIAGTTTLTLPAVSGTVVSTTGANLFVPDLKRCSAPVTANATVAYANVTGLSFTVVPGTYAFECALPSTVASGTGGIKYAFNYTTAVLSAIEATGIGMTAAAVAVQHTTTTTTQTDLFSQAAVVLFVRVTGTMVVTTGGTVDVQVAQNTSNASNTVALLGGWAQFTRIA